MVVPWGTWREPNLFWRVEPFAMRERWAGSSSAQAVLAEGEGLAPAIRELYFDRATQRRRRASIRRAREAGGRRDEARLLSAGGKGESR